MATRYRKTLPLRMPDDTTAFNNANDFLESMGVRYKRPSMDQLKIGKMNYYPNTGTIQIDGGARLRQRGKKALLALLLKDRLVLDEYVERRLAEKAAAEVAKSLENAEREEDKLAEKAATRAS